MRSSRFRFRVAQVFRPANRPALGGTEVPRYTRMKSALGNRSFDVTPDGTRFVLSVERVSSTPVSLTVAVNWKGDMGKHQKGGIEI